MKKRTKLFAMIFALLTIFTASASNSKKSRVQNVLYWAAWVKNNKYTTYRDYARELNYDTIDAPHDEKEDFSPVFMYYTKKENLYCTEVFLDGIKDRLLAMMQLEGSGKFPHLRIFRFNSKTKKWSIYFSAYGSRGECGLVYPIQNPITGQTFFLEELRNFDNKRLVAYKLLSLKNKEWINGSTAEAQYIYNLRDEESEWISPDIIERMAAFDYSFMGIEDDHPSLIERETGNIKIVAKLYHTSVARMPSNFSITVFENEKEILKMPEVIWGFNTVEKDGKPYLVYIGMGRPMNMHSSASAMEDFMLNVLDLSTLEHVFRSYIKPEIIFDVRE